MNSSIDLLTIGFIEGNYPTIPRPGQSLNACSGMGKAIRSDGFLCTCHSSPVSMHGVNSGWNPEITAPPLAV
jgi:hypothetical protein